MKNILSVLFLGTILLSSCVSSKKYNELDVKKKNLANELKEEQVRLIRCLDAQKSELQYHEKSNADLRQQIDILNKTNSALLDNIGNLSNLSSEGAKNLEKTLESIREKDLQISSMRDAINKKDSLTLALVTSIKGVLGNFNDEDIEVSVEKGVVFISISDKLLFTSGSFTINNKAKPVLAKVAKVLNDKPTIEFMVEGHTDSVPIKTDGIADNWDLSVLRGASVVRILQNDYEVDPKRMTAAGRSSYLPIDENNNPQGRSRNRRTRIVILPKIDEFYNMVEEGTKQAIENDTKK